MKKMVVDNIEHHAFYGKIFCRECGALFKRRALTAKSGEKHKAWNCAERQKGKKGNGCKCRIWSAVDD